MIYVSDGINLGASSQRLLYKLSKTNSVIVKRVVGPEEPVATSAHIPTQDKSSGVSRNYTPSAQAALKQYGCYRASSGTLVKNWNSQDTISLKKRLTQEYKVPIESLVRVGDLGIRTPKKVHAVGVIFTAVILANHTTTQSPGTVKKEGTVILVDSQYWSDVGKELITNYQTELKALLLIWDSARNLLAIKKYRNN